MLSLLSGCGTVKRAAMRNVTGMLVGGGSGTAFMSDDDPELVRDALPFALKTYETLLVADPGNSDLCLASASGFIQYANAFLEDDAERLEDENYEESQRLRARAVGLYLRGRDYALRGLETAHKGFLVEVRTNPEKAVSRLKKSDVPMVYWAGAGWASAIAAAPGRMDLVAELSTVDVLMRRALALDADDDHGSLYEFFVAFDGGRAEAMGGSMERAAQHFERAVELSGGLRASPYVTYASTVAVGLQDYALFKDLLSKAAAIDVNERPEWKLANTISQRKAEWLLSRSVNLFLDYEEIDE